MIIKYLGHSTFLFKAEDGTTVLTDPYKPGAYGGALTYAPIADSADIVVLSHDHEDHADLQSLPNQPLVVRSEARVRGIDFDVIHTYHDAVEGKERGKNRITCFIMDDIRVCHAGDLGHVLSESQVAEIGALDVLLLPVGGRFTLGPADATHVAGQLRPKVVIPMHFKTDKCGFPIEPVTAFLEGKSDIKRSPTSEVILHKEDLPEKCTVLYIPPGN
ncbi:MAG TPA: MBL fold metallo-hydrolase [bacterium]|nr:MBL fold metallo-hydrolase [Candidatus Omnitrophota bacterium]HOJ58956.1 MBL fold metallo-hydrolase [bacterium]HOL96597.1 MBL fold metallo-hydrolase [bacterium]HPO99609.1 MBL fold metallo-hydrolase [bacterium]HXK93590.1 MBL fold metallo-hydrolase [bacterium]